MTLASFGYAGTLTLQERFVTIVPDRLLGQGMGLAGSGVMTAQAVCAMIVGATAELVAPGIAMTVAGGASLMVSLALLSRPWPQTTARRASADVAEAATPG